MSEIVVTKIGSSRQLSQGGTPKAPMRREVFDDLIDIKEGTKEFCEMNDIDFFTFVGKHFIEDVVYAKGEQVEFIEQEEHA